MSKPTILPLSPSLTRPFTPPCAEQLKPKPVYLLRPLGWRERAQFNADMTEEGVIAVSQAEFYEVARAGLDSAVSNEETRAALHEVIDQHEAIEAGTPIPPEIGMRWREIIQMLSLPNSPMARLTARHMLFQQMAPVIQLKRSLIGWKNGPGAFRLAPTGAVSDETINLIPANELQELTSKALSLASPTREQEKNFVSPPGSRSNRRSLRSGGTSRAGSTGSSMGRRSRKTRS